LDETETFRREYRNSFDETEKLFRGIPLNQIGFETTCLIILGGYQNHSGNFLEFSGMKTGNVPELPEPLWLLFAEENIVLELFRNALKIILVGTGNVLSPHKYFQFIRTLKNVIMNSESAFWIFLEKHLFGIFQKASRRGLVARHLMGGPPQGWPAKRRWSSMELHMALPYGIFLFRKGSSGGILVFSCANTTPWFSYK
jgi:hypothetical protein